MAAFFGSMIGAGIGAAASIFGGIKASEAMKKIKDNLEQQRTNNQNWYDRRYNEDATQRASAQAILAKTEESIRKRNKQAAGVQAVMGGTDESVAAAKAANNDTLAQATTNIAVNAEARKDAIESQYLQNDANLQAQLNEVERNKAANIAKATEGVIKAGAKIGENYFNTQEYLNRTNGSNSK